METKWTPGPWYVDSAPWLGLKFGVLEQQSGEVIAACREITLDADRQNAHLIAAAPDLYEALSNIENDDGRIPESIWAMRNAALAKARGES